MSEENVELTRRAFVAFNREGVEAFDNTDLWSPEIVFDATPSGVPGMGVYRGYDEVRRFLEEDWFGVFPFEEWELELEELIDHDDHVIAMCRQRGRGTSSGVAAEVEFAIIESFRDGQLVRSDFYLDRGKALEAAGLSE
jgi:ketosteroid isomerase-like protein